MTRRERYGRIQRGRRRGRRRARHRRRLWPPDGRSRRGRRPARHAPTRSAEMVVVRGSGGAAGASDGLDDREAASDTGLLAAGPVHVGHRQSAAAATREHRDSGRWGGDPHLKRSKSVCPGSGRRRRNTHACTGPSGAPGACSTARPPTSAVVMPHQPKMTATSALPSRGCPPATTEAGDTEGASPRVRH